MSPAHTSRRRLATAVTTAVTLAAAFVGAGSAGATTTPGSAHARFSITEHVSSVGTTFTATGPLCASGTVTDRPFAVNLNRQHTVQLRVVQSTFTCDDGSGAFFAVQKLIRIQPHGKATDNGTAVFRGGTGLYGTVAGKGTDHGTYVSGAGTATILGHLTSLPDLP